MDSILEDVRSEREHQDKKWGKLSARNLSPLDFLCIMMEEVGEVAECINDMGYSRLRTSDYRKELVQVAAAAVAAIQEFDRIYGHLENQGR